MHHGRTRRRGGTGSGSCGCGARLGRIPAPSDMPGRDGGGAGIALVRDVHALIEVADFLRVNVGHLLPIAHPQRPLPTIGPYPRDDRGEMRAPWKIIVAVVHDALVVVGQTECIRLVLLKLTREIATWLRKSRSFETSSIPTNQAVNRYITSSSINRSTARPEGWIPWQQSITHHHDTPFLWLFVREKARTQSPNYQKFWPPAPIFLTEEASFIVPEVRWYHSTEGGNFLIFTVPGPGKYELLNVSQSILKACHITPVSRKSTSRTPFFSFIVHYFAPNSICFR